LVLVTGRYVRLTDRLAGSAERSAASAERSVQLQVLPLVDVTRGPLGSGGGQPPRIAVSVQNIGPTAALDVIKWFRIGEENEDGYQTFGNVHLRRVLRPGEEADHTTQLTDEQAKAFQQNPSPVYLIVQFTDAFGGIYKTERRGNELALYELVGQGPPRWEQINPPKYQPPD
jgi:hypothetical protein